MTAIEEVKENCSESISGDRTFSLNHSLPGGLFTTNSTFAFSYGI